MKRDDKKIQANTQTPQTSTTTVINNKQQNTTTNPISTTKEIKQEKETQINKTV